MQLASSQRESLIKSGVLLLLCCMRSCICAVRVQEKEKTHIQNFTKQREAGAQFGLHPPLGPWVMGFADLLLSHLFPPLLQEKFQNFTINSRASWNFDTQFVCLSEFDTEYTNYFNSRVSHHFSPFSLLSFFPLTNKQWENTILPLCLIPSP